MSKVRAVADEMRAVLDADPMLPPTPEQVERWYSLLRALAEEQEKWGQIRKAIDDALAVGKEERVSDKHGPFPNCPTCEFPIDAGGFCGLNCPDPKPAVTMPCTCTECRAEREGRKP